MPPELPIGTVDLPDRVDRDRYFGALSYLELSALFGGPLKPGALAKWAEEAPDGALGLVAPWVFAQRKPPATQKSWDHDATVGEFRDSAPGRAALAQFRAALDQVKARCAIFRSPSLYAPSAANRDQLTKFFEEVATVEALGGTQRVWIPDGLWEPRAAIKFANEIGVTCAIDPLVIDPNAPTAFDNLECESLYVRVEGLGRAGTLSTERLESILDFVQVYEDVDITLVFASPERWKDARNFAKLQEESD